MLAAHAHHIPGVLCTLLYVVAVVASIVAVVLLLLSLFGQPRGTNWLYAAAVALVAWLLLAFFC